MAHKHSHSADVSNVSSTVAKTDDGTLQITFSIPWKLVEKTRDEVIEEMAHDFEIPGFRKGKAPINKVKEKLPQDSVINHTLGHILPEALGKTISENKLKIAIYPKYELLKAEEGSDWEIRALSCELPEVELGDYRKNIEGEGRASKLWTPEKGKAKEEPTKAQKQDVVIKALIASAKITIPKILLEEEVNARLSSLLDRVEKLGLNFDNYLSNLGKTAEQVRKEYTEISENTLKLDLALAKVIEKEKIEVSEKDVDEAIKASSADPVLAKQNENPEQRGIVKRVLQKQAALDSLMSLL